MLLKAPTMNIAALLMLLLAAGGSVITQNAPTKPNKVKLQPCEIAGPEKDSKLHAQCATLEVFENRVTKRGRKIPINILIFPATGNDKAPDPFFYIPGGPGSAATDDAPYVLRDFARIREHRDLVFVDQRGTGGSNALNCSFFDPNDPQSYLGHWNPPAEVRKCKIELEKKADLRLYTTSIAMDDLDDVRAGLGYEKINIIGGSYGTRATQEYVRLHGNHVRAIVLHGVSLTRQFMPRDFPRDTERAIDGVLSECAAEAECRKAFPDLQADKRKVLDRLRSGPVDVDIKFPENSNKTVRVRLTRDLAAEAVRYLLYQTSSGGRLPLFLHSAAEGNFRPLAQAAIFFRQNLVGTGATGMYLSVTCAEDLPWARTGGQRDVEDTFLGNYRLRQQLEDCAIWPRGKVRGGYSLPLKSKVPALILTGQWDPVTPPVYGDKAAEFLPNSLHIVVPSGGHGFDGLDGLNCIDNLIADFIAGGTVKDLDTACVRSIRRRGFLLGFENQPK